MVDLQFIFANSYLGLGGLGDGGGGGKSGGEGGGGDGDGGFSGGGDGNGGGFVGGGEETCIRARCELDPSSDCGISKI